MRLELEPSSSLVRPRNYEEEIIRSAPTRVPFPGAAAQSLVAAPSSPGGGDDCHLALLSTLAHAPGRAAILRRPRSVYLQLQNCRVAE